MVTETDLQLSDGRTLHAYDTGANYADSRLAVAQIVPSDPTTGLA